MNILVTGASGFLGTSLCKKLRDNKNDVTELNSKNCDLTIGESLYNFSDIKYDYIYHLAAWTQAGDFCLSHPAEQWIRNQQINTNVLSWWCDIQPQAKLICMGTSCSYAPDQELVESNYLTGQPIDSLYTYAMTKRMLYIGLIAAQKQYGLNYMCYVPSTLYGSNYHTDGRQMHFIFDLIRKIVKGKLYGEKVILWGDGYQKRELVYVDDFVEVAATLSERENNILLNIGAGEDYSIRRFADIICNYVGFDESDIVYDETKYVGAKSKCLSTEKLTQYMPEFKRTPLDIGLKKTIDWMMSNIDSV